MNRRRAPVLGSSYELLRLLPPRPDDAERARPDERLPPAPFFFDAVFFDARFSDDRPASFAVERPLERPLSLLVVWRCAPRLRRVTPPCERVSFDELLRPLAMWRFSFWSVDCKDCA
jgi:hypothetical protein